MIPGERRSQHSGAVSGAVGADSAGIYKERTRGQFAKGCGESSRARADRAQPANPLSGRKGFAEAGGTGVLAEREASGPGDSEKGWLAGLVRRSAPINRSARFTKVGFARRLRQFGGGRGRTGRNVFRGETGALQAIPVARANVIVLVLVVHQFYGDGAPATVGIGLGVVTQRIKMR